jgi:hypothetical protein
MAAAGPAATEYTILLTQEGGIRMVSGTDWSLDCLMRERGVDRALRIVPGAAAVRLEAREGLRSWRVEAPRAAAFSPTPRLSETPLLLPAAWG